MAQLADREDLAPYLQPTWFIDSDNPTIIEFAQAIVDGHRDPRAAAVRLFYAIRDTIRYSAYSVVMAPEYFRASHTLAQGQGWCVTKSCLLAAVARASGIACRLGFANVRNHLATRKLFNLMGTDIFYYHGYNEFYLDGHWVKATVAFNASLCEKARLRPLDWDGRNDALYHPFDLDGKRHMEYLHHYGHFADLPYDRIVAKFNEVYPRFAIPTMGEQTSPPGDFEAEIEAESQRGND
jgi:hypothetical protein